MVNLSYGQIVTVHIGRPCIRDSTSQTQGRVKFGAALTHRYVS